MIIWNKRPTHSPTPQELQPGGMSLVGFLERGQTIEQVMERDRKALEMLGYTTQEVAGLLAPVTEKAANGENFEYTAPNGKQFQVKVQTWMGTQECPWRDKVDWRKSSGAMDMHLTEKGEGGKPVHIAGLVRHLVEEHGFFEGGSYRVAPEKIVAMFGTEKIPGSLAKVGKLKFLNCSALPSKNRARKKFRPIKPRPI
jgi:hypothetical protein